MKTKALESYAAACISHQEKHKYGGRVDHPAECNTLWIPKYSGNRTATYNLNHEVFGFDDFGFLWGRNGNCCTPYVILEVSKHWGEKELNDLCERICNKINKPEDYPKRRVLKVERLDIIRETIAEMI